MNRILVMTFLGFLQAQCAMVQVTRSRRTYAEIVSLGTLRTRCSSSSGVGLKLLCREYKYLRGSAND